jgi:hypothetical protein
MENDKAYEYWYYDIKLKNIIFKCRAQDKIEANKIFEKETGANPLKLSSIRSWLVMLDNNNARRGRK